MTVNNLINQIKKEPKAVVMRSLIADTFKELNSNVDGLQNTFDSMVVNAGNSNAEIVTARNDSINQNQYNTLGERLNNISTMLNTINNNIKELQDAQASGADAFFPVEANPIYITMIDINPGTFLGGTWEKVGQGKTLVGVDTSDSDFEEAGYEGGSKNYDLRALIGAVDGNLNSLGYAATGTIPGYTKGQYNRGIFGNSIGNIGEKPINHTTKVLDSNGNMPTTVQPYLTVYFWRRTA